MSTWLALLAVPALLTGLPSGTGECASCHSESRNLPPARFSFGVGKWGEMQCYGCHAEMADIGKNLIEKGEDNRAFGLPYSATAMKRFAQGHGPFLNATSAPAWKVAGIERIDSLRVRDFIAHPPTRSDGRSMIPFPRIDHTLKAPLLESEVRQGANVFSQKCAPCHGLADGPAGRGPLHLALFTSQWLYSYAQGAIPTDGQRRMPRVSLSQAEARAIAATLESERRNLIARVDHSFVTKGKEAQRLLQAKSTTGANPPFSLTGFLREGGCVHCHEGNHRAAQLFLASPAGVTTYVERHGPKGLLTRLLVRRSEIEQGIVGSKPGMPASLASLPLERIRSLAQWIASTCSTLKGTTTCAH